MGREHKDGHSGGRGSFEALGKYTICIRPLYHDLLLHCTIDKPVTVTVNNSFNNMAISCPRGPVP